MVYSNKCYYTSITQVPIFKSQVHLITTVLIFEVEYTTLSLHAVQTQLIQHSYRATNRIHNCKLF